MTTVHPPRTLATVAADAVNRLDDGHALPGDVLLADRYDEQCRQSYDAFQDRLDRVQRLAWLDAHREVCDEGCEHCVPEDGE